MKKIIAYQVTISYAQFEGLVNGLIVEAKSNSKSNTGKNISIKARYSPRVFRLGKKGNPEYLDPISKDSREKVKKKGKKTRRNEKNRQYMGRSLKQGLKKEAV